MLRSIPTVCITEGRLKEQPLTPFLFPSHIGWKHRLLGDDPNHAELPGDFSILYSIRSLGTDQFQSQ